MKVSFITVCYKTPNLVRLLLRGIERANFSFPYEYILVDNGDDGTARMVRERFPWVTVLEPGANLGFAKANNLAIAQAKGEYVMLTNPDLTVFPGEMEKLIAAADALPESGVFAPWVENPNGTRQENCVRFPHLFIPVCQRTVIGRLPWGKRTLDRYHMRDVDHTSIHHPDSVYGAAMLIRQEVIRKIGGLDERFFMYYEDVDFCRRVWQGGWKVTFIPHARFVHYHQRESLVRAPWELITNQLVRVHILSALKYFLKYSKKA